MRHLNIGNPTTPDHRSRSARLVAALAIVTIVLLAVQALRAQPPRARVQKAELEVVTDRSSYAAGAELRLASRITVEDGWHIQSHQPALEYLIPTVLEIETPAEWSTGPIEYPEAKTWQASFEAEPLLVYDGESVILARISSPESQSPGTYELLARLEYQACDDRVCLPPTTIEAAVEIVVGEQGELTHQELFESAPGAGQSRKDSVPLSRLGIMLLAGLLGGLILNAMPCVLPILSLKVFGLVKAAGQGRAQVTAGALASALGILLSFWALAAVAIGIRAAGGLVGWGIQFQNPMFVAFLVVVLVFFCLNMWGLFEITLPSSLGGVLGGVAAKTSAASSSGAGSGSNFAGHLGSGLFATLMATPCSAPFLGTAVGFALSQSALFTLLIFTAVGAGMALPYLALAVAPGIASGLPKPGPWMEHLRGAMGFLLAGTAIWLLYVLSAQLEPTRLALVEVTLLLIAFFAWLKRRMAGWPRPPALATVGMLVAAVGAMVLARPGEGERRGSAIEPGSRIPWVEFDEARAQRLAAEGGLVFVDVTADWCATCKVNERLVLETDRVRDAFERYGVVAMKADWTNRNDRIASYLADFGRYAIPFYVLYRPDEDPHVFGELLTKGSVLRAIEESGVPLLDIVPAVETASVE